MACVKRYLPRVSAGSDSDDDDDDDDDIEDEDDEIDPSELEDLKRDAVLPLGMR